MSVAHEYMIRTILRAIGVNIEDLSPENILPMALGALDISPNDARIAFAKVQQFILDYERNQALNEKRLLAIMAKLGIADIQSEQLENENGNDA